MNDEGVTNLLIRFFELSFLDYVNGSIVENKLNGKSPDNYEREMIRRKNSSAEFYRGTRREKDILKRAEKYITTGKFIRVYETKEKVTGGRDEYL